MRTAVRVLRGRYRGQAGSIAGNLEDRAARGITRAIVRFPGDIDMLATSSLEPEDQLVLFPDPPHASNRPPHRDRNGRDPAGRDRRGGVWLKHK